jgi:serine/threonine protein kinase
VVPQAGDVLHGYLLRARIGAGAHGDVFAARDLTLGRDVAVKVLRPRPPPTGSLTAALIPAASGAADAAASAARRFTREARVTALLSRCPFIVTVYDFGRERTGALFLVLELLNGRPLDELIAERIDARRPFTALEIVYLMLPVLKALVRCCLVLQPVQISLLPCVLQLAALIAFFFCPPFILLLQRWAHSCDPPIIHRDLKPENVWVNRVSDASEGRLLLTKVMDYGIALTLHAESGHHADAGGRSTTAGTACKVR